MTRWSSLKGGGLTIDENVSKKISKEVKDAFYENQKITRIRTRIWAETATTSELYELADEVGNILSKSLKENIGSALTDVKVLEDAFAKILVSGPLSSSAELINNEYAIFQNAFNKKLGTNLKALDIEPNADRINGFANKIASDPASIEWMSEAPTKNFTRNVVTENIKKNAEFLDKAGFKVQITRRLGSGGCCEWCKKLAGTYTMPDVPSEVFQAHDRCDCEIEVTKADRSYFMRKSGHGFTAF